MMTKQTNPKTESKDNKSVVNGTEATTPTTIPVVIPGDGVGSIEELIDSSKPSSIQEDTTTKSLPKPINYIKHNRLLAIVCAGDNSLHEKWLNNKLFDSLVIYYGKDEAIGSRYKEGATFYANRAGIKFNLIWNVINENLAGLTEEQLLSYDYIWLVDDDILTDSTTVKSMFDTMEAEHIDLGQAALTKDSHSFWRTLFKDGIRTVPFTTVEIMMPFFSKRFFAEQYKYWQWFQTGHSLDLRIWSKISNENGWLSAVVNKYAMKHTRKGGTGDVYKNSTGIRPAAELALALRMLQIDANTITPYRRVKVEAINGRNRPVVVPVPNFNQTIYYNSPKFYTKSYGFFDFEEIYQEAVHRATNGAKFIEVGVMQGKSACYLGECIKESGKQIKVELIDIWVHEQDTTQQVINAQYKGTDIPFYPLIETNAIAKPYELLKEAGLLNYFNFVQASSFDAHKLYDNGSIDFIFIDGDHQYGSVIKDLTNFYPKLKPGGLFAGHDYNADLNPGVVRAVNEFIAKHRLKLYVYEDKLNKPYIIYK